jgi:hypothetical protein
MDHNVHAAITKGLRDRGVDCITALEDSMDAADDESVLKRACDLGRTVFSQDTDFLEITARWIAEGREFRGVIYASQMGVTVGQAIADLELCAKVLGPGDMKNVLERLPLK